MAQGLVSQVAQGPVSQMAQGLVSLVAQGLDWGFGGIWRFQTGVLVPEHHENGSAMSQATYVPKFSFLH